MRPPRNALPAWQRRRGEAGSAAVEAILVVPLVLIPVLFAVFIFGRTGTGSASSAWATSVDLPTCRGPATTWMNRRGSARRLASSAACGRR